MDTTANLNPDDFLARSQSRMDEGLLVKFYIKAKEDKVESKKQGRPIFKDVEYIDIKIPGNRLAGVARPATMNDVERFPRHYAAFKNRVSEDYVEGTLLAEWPVMSRSMVEQLTFFNVKTVEQLVAMSDNDAQKFMGLNAMKAKAKEWLVVAKEGKAASDLAAQLEKRDQEIEELKAQMAELMAQAKPAVRKKRGRKKAPIQEE